MNSNLLFDFTVNKENNTIVIKREFAANLELVWQAWTTAELLDQWWGPKPYRSETKTMEFRVGGFRLYAMVSPEGEKHWAREDYQQIVQHKNFSSIDSFCDENGNENPDLPKSLWENHFEQTLVKVFYRDIVAFEAQGNYVLIYLKNRRIKTYLTFSDLAMHLNDHVEFIQLHRSFIISVNFLAEIKRGQIRMENGLSFMVGDKYKDTFNSFLSNYLLKSCKNNQEQRQ